MEENMEKKFEIRSHDGPGRIGKIEDELTPKIFYKNQIRIAPNQGSAYNIDRESAEFNVKETLRLAEEHVEECDIAVIQGSKLLRLSCSFASVSERGRNMKDGGWKDFMGQT